MGEATQAASPDTGGTGQSRRSSAWERVGTTYARMAIGAAFLSAVAGRFGIWKGHIGLQSFRGFLEYASEVLAFMPAASIPLLAWAATVAELFLGVALILGVWPRRVAFGSAGLLALFGTSMAVSMGLKSPLDYSVFSASAGALLLGLQAARESQERR